MNPLGFPHCVLTSTATQQAGLNCYVTVSSQETHKIGISIEQRQRSSRWKHIQKSAKRMNIPSKVN